MRVEKEPDGTIILWCSNEEYWAVAEAIPRLEIFCFSNRLEEMEHVVLDFPRGKFIAARENESPQE